MNKECEVCGETAQVYLTDEDHKRHWYCRDCAKSGAAIDHVTNATDT
jgi:ribosome-binding protein aMBF1 (putative translation factor)